MSLFVFDDFDDNAQRKVWPWRILQYRRIKIKIWPSCLRCNWSNHSIYQNVNGNKFIILISWWLCHLFKKWCFRLQLLCLDYRLVSWSLIHSHGSRNHARVRYWLECNEELATNFMGSILWPHCFTWWNSDFPFWCLQRVWALINVHRFNNLSRALFLCEKYWIGWHAHPSLQYWNHNDDFHRLLEYIFNHCPWSYEWNFHRGSYSV